MIKGKSDYYMTKVKEKKEFLFYVVKIKHHIKIQMMLGKYKQHR